MLCTLPESCVVPVSYLQTPPPQTHTGQARAQADEFALLPPLRGGDLGWEYVGRKGASRNTFGPGSNSALVGDYRPPEPLIKQAAAAAAAAPQPAAAAAPAAGRGGAAAPKAKAKPVNAEDITNK